ncbi:MAG: LamG-like jellyroll fold domain-containing protein, partial [Candidatus Thorarchaeota archaeon]
MANYPNSQPNLTDPTSDQQLSQPSHSLLHVQTNDEIEAIAAELGLNPSGGFATVDARITATEIAVNLWQLNGNVIEPATLNRDLDILLGNINSASMTSDLFTTTNNGKVDAYDVDIASTLDFLNTGGIQNLTWLADNSLLLGDDFDTDKTLFARNGDANYPAIRYNSTDSEWEFSNDGLTFTQFDSSVLNAVTAAAVLTAGAVPVGDTGARDLVSSGVSIDGSNNVTGVNDLTITGTLAGVSSLSLTTLTVTGASSFANTTSFNGVAFTWPGADGLLGQMLTTDGSGGLTWSTPGGGGNVTTGTIADHALVRGDGGTQGIQDSGIIIDDSNNISGIVNLTATGTTTLNTLAYTWPGAHGNSGDQLTNNGAGVLSWSAPGTAVVFPDNTFRIQDNADATSELAFNVDAIATTTTRTITMPDNDVDLANIHTQNTDTGTNSNTFAVGNGSTGTDKDLVADNGTANLPTLRYEDGSSEWQFSNDGVLFTAIGAGQGEGLARDINQATHGFSVGEILRFNGTVYVLAQADTEENADSVGVVIGITDVNNFVLMQAGYNSGAFSGLTPGDVYWLSPTVAGAIQTAKPTTAGQIAKPLLIADTATSAYYYNWRSIEVSGDIPVDDFTILNTGGVLRTAPWIPDNIVLNAMNIASNHDLSVTGMVDGALDTFTDETGIAVNSNATFEGGSYLTPAVQFSADTALLLNFSFPDNSLEIADTSGQDHIVTQSGNATLAPNHFKWGNGALCLNGVDQYLTLAESTDFDLKTDTTVDVWFKLNQPNSDNGLISYVQDNDNRWFIGINHTTPTLNFEFFERTAAVTNANTSTPINGNDNDWHHFIFSKIAGVGSFWLDGIQIAYMTGLVTQTLSPATLSIGSINGVNLLDGYLDDFRITDNNAFNLIGAAAPIDKPYLHLTLDDNAASIFVTDFGSGGNLGAVNGTSPNTQDRHADGKVRYSFDLNGTDNYINMGGGVHTKIVGDSVGTIAMWVNPDAIADMMLFSATDASAIEYGAFFIRNGTGVLASNFTNGAATQVCSYDSTNAISANVWTHVAMVQDGGGGGIKFYINGVLETSVPNGPTTDPDAWFDTPTGIDGSFVGMYSINSGGPSKHFNGRIDDFRYYDVVLNQTQIESIRVAGIAGIYGLGSPNISVPSTQHVDDANTMLLLPFDHLVQGQDLVDISTGGAGSPHTVTPVPTTGAPGATGHFGNAYLTLDGTNSLTIPENTTEFRLNDTIAGDKTVAFWFRLAEVTSGARYWYTYYSGATTYNWIRHEPGQGLGLNISTGSPLINNQTADITDYNWHFYTLVKKGDITTADYSIYLDGTQVAFMSSPIISNSGDTMSVGSNRDANGFVIGDMDDFHFNAGNPFSAAPVAQPFIQLTMNDNLATTNVIDTGTGSNDGTLNVNTDTLSIAGQINTALDFNGTSNFVNMDTAGGVIDSDTTGSMSAWIYVDTVAASRVVYCLANTTAQTRNQIFVTATQTFRLFIQNTGTVLIDVETPVTSIPLATWTHVVASQDGVSPRLYINGVNQSLTTNTATDLTAWNGTLTTPNNLRIGCQNFNSTGNLLFFDGRLDDVRYYQHPLSQAQIDDIYNSGTGTESFALDSITVPAAQAVADANSVLLLNCNTIDESLSYNIPTFNGNAHIAINGLVAGSNGALQLNGTNQYLSAVSNADFEANQVSPANYTVSTFYRQDVESVADDNLVSGWFTINGFSQFLKHVPSGGGQTLFQSAGRDIAFGPTASWRLDQTAISADRTTVDINQNNHEAWCRVGNNLGYYYNGTQVMGGYFDFVNNGYTNGESMFVGQRGDNTGHFPGLMDDTFATNDNHFNADPMPIPRLHFKLNDNTTNGTVLDSGGGASNPFNGLLFSLRLSNTVSAGGNAAPTNLGFFFDILAVPAISFDVDSFASTIRLDTTGTISMWVNQVTQATDQMLFSAGDTVGSSAYGAFFIRSTGVLASNFTDAAGTQVCSYNSTNTISTGVWTHVAMTQPLDGGGPDFYINGVLEVSVPLVATTPNAWFSTPGGNVDNVRIASYQRNGLASQLYADATIDDIRYYQSALSAAHMLRIVAGGSGDESSFPSDPGITIPTAPHVPTAATMFSLAYEPLAPFTDDSPTTPHTFTPSGSPYVTGRFETGYMEFDGTGDWITIPTNSRLNIVEDHRTDQTVQFWFRKDTVGTVESLMSYYVDGNNFWAIQLLASNNIQFAFQTGGVGPN